MRHLVLYDNMTLYIGIKKRISNVATTCCMEINNPPPPSERSVTGE